MSLGGNLSVGNTQITYGVQDASQATKEAANECRSQSVNINSTYEDQLQSLELDADSTEIVAEIEEKNTDISDHQLDIEDKNTTISENEAKITENEGLISALDATITNCGNQITALGNQITSLNGQLSSLGDDKDSESKKAALKGQIANLQSQKTTLENQKKKAESDKKKLEDENTKLTESNTTLQGEIEEIQGEIDKLSQEITTLGEQLAEANEANQEIADLNNARSTALSTVATAAGEIEAQAEKNEEEKEKAEAENGENKGEEGFNYGEMNGNFITKEQLDTVGYDKEKVDKINDKLEAMGLSSRVSLEDGLSAAEANMILGLSKKAQFGENDRYSQTELDALMSELGIQAQTSVNDSQYTISKGDFATGAQVKNKDNDAENQTKVWQANYKDGMVTTSKADYVGLSGKADSHIDNKYTYDKEAGKLNLESTKTDYNYKEKKIRGTEVTQKSSSSDTSNVSMIVDEDKAKEIGSNFKSAYSKENYIGVRKAAKETIDGLKDTDPKQYAKASAKYDEIVNSDKDEKAKMEAFEQLEKDLAEGKFKEEEKAWWKFW